MPEITEVNQQQLDALVDAVFVRPQSILSQREKGKAVRLDNAAVIAVKFMTNEPSRASTMVTDPIIIRLCVKDSNQMLSEATDDDLANVLAEAKRRDSAIGGWTLIHDVRPRPDDQRATWRIAAEVRPSSVESISWQRSGQGKLLCVDVIAAGVFVGRQKKASRRGSKTNK